MKHQDFSVNWTSEAPVYYFECTTFNGLGEAESVKTFQIANDETTINYSRLDVPAAERNLRQLR